MDFFLKGVDGFLVKEADNANITPNHWCTIKCKKNVNNMIASGNLQ